MKELLDKIGSYNLFNYLLPGILFSAFLPLITPYSITQDSLVTGAFVYYFAGLVISRVGSIIVEPALKKTSFVVFAKYEDFVAASKVDPKIEMFSEVNNMYRTLIAMLLSLLLARSYSLLSLQIPMFARYGVYLMILALLVMFLFAYRKQSNYITKRVKVAKPS